MYQLALTHLPDDHLQRRLIPITPHRDAVARPVKPDNLAVAPHGAKWAHLRIVEHRRHIEQFSGRRLRGTHDDQRITRLQPIGAAFAAEVSGTFDWQVGEFR